MGGASLAKFLHPLPLHLSEFLLNWNSVGGRVEKGRLGEDASQSQPKLELIQSRKMPLTLSPSELVRLEILYATPSAHVSDESWTYSWLQQWLGRGETKGRATLLPRNSFRFVGKQGTSERNFCFLRLPASGFDTF